MAYRKKVWISFEFQAFSVSGFRVPKTGLSATFGGKFADCVRIPDCMCAVTRTIRVLL